MRIWWSIEAKRGLRANPILCKGASRVGVWLPKPGGDERFSISNPPGFAAPVHGLVLQRFRCRRSPEIDLPQYGLLSLGHALDRTSMLAKWQSCALRARIQVRRAATGIQGSAHRWRAPVQDVRCRVRSGLLA